MSGQWLPVRNRRSPPAARLTHAAVPDRRLRGAVAQALASADVAAVLLRLADGDERSLINRIKTVAPAVQDKGAALIVDGHAAWSRAAAPTAPISPASRPSTTPSNTSGLTASPAAAASPAGTTP